jgi:hypothetical protein
MRLVTTVIASICGRGWGDFFEGPSAGLLGRPSRNGRGDCCRLRPVGGPRAPVFWGACASAAQAAPKQWAAQPAEAGRGGGEGPPTRLVDGGPAVRVQRQQRIHEAPKLGAEPRRQRRVPALDNLRVWAVWGGWGLWAAAGVWGRAVWGRALRGVGLWGRAAPPRGVALLCVERPCLSCAQAGAALAFGSCAPAFCRPCTRPAYGRSGRRHGPLPWVPLVPRQPTGPLSALAAPLISGSAACGPRKAACRPRARTARIPGSTRPSAGAPSPRHTRERSEAAPRALPRAAAAAPGQADAACGVRGAPPRASGAPSRAHPRHPPARVRGKRARAPTLKP